MDTPEVEERTLGDPVSVHSNPAREFSDEGNKIQLHLRLLSSAPKRIPKWMSHYRLASYIVYTIIACYSLIYLIFIGVHQANPRFQIQYSAIVRYLEYNSYSILSPLLCPVLMCILIYHVKYRIKLDEGDFFGFMGLLLFLALLNFHDGWGMLKILHWKRAHDLKSQVYIDPPSKDDTFRNDLHWQYAWSTRTVCARKFVRDLQYKYEYSKKHVVRQIVFELFNPVQMSARQGPNGGQAVMECNGYHDVKQKARIRAWMKDVQNEFKCCGPYGYLEWKQWFEDEKSTGCKTKLINNRTGDIPSCFGPLMEWLDPIMVATFWIMLIQGICYIICIFTAGLHHSAMKLEEEKIEKKYSLLSLTDRYADPEPHWWTISRPENDSVIVGEYPLRPKIDDDMDLNDIEILVSSGTQQRNSNKVDSDTRSLKGSKKKKRTKDHI